MTQNIHSTFDLTEEQNLFQPYCELNWSTKVIEYKPTPGECITVINEWLREEEKTLTTLLEVEETLPERVAQETEQLQCQITASFLLVRFFWLVGKFYA
ncbi:MAG: hypothetical protein LBG52_02100 [Candidatus Peribacteria bacterium]|jgi:hypothetical protein|nr:hypothetical protein [Candidatus Peribacteria bacterium]